MKDRLFVYTGRAWIEFNNVLGTLVALNTLLFYSMLYHTHYLTAPLTLNYSTNRTTLEFDIASCNRISEMYIHFTSLLFDNFDRNILDHGDLEILDLNIRGMYSKLERLCHLIKYTRTWSARHNYYLWKLA